MSKAEEALDKIEAILKEYDLWGVAMVTDTERTYWKYHMGTSWSCADKQGDVVRIRAKVTDFATKEIHHKVVEQTAGAIFNTRDCAAMVFANMDSMAKELEKLMEIEHHPFTDFKPGRFR